MTILIDKNQIIGACRRLPLQIDTNKLLEEIRSIPAALWGEQRANVHEQVSAVFVKGYPPVQRKPDDDRPVLNTLPYLRKVIYEMLPGEPGKCVVADLKPKGRVLMHRDGYLEDPKTQDRYFYDYFHSTLRFHIPITTNDQVAFFCHDGFYRMRVGEVWTINNTSDHAVINGHPTESRIHIIVDIHPNADMYALLEQSESGTGWMDKDALQLLMSDSNAPAVSPYAQGKPLPV